MDEYTAYYALSYFRKDRTTSLSQIFHVFHAKRTPSMFYMIESNQWHHGFDLKHAVTHDELKNIIKSLCQNKLIKKEGKGYVLSDDGEKKCQAYFEHHYYPQYVKTFSNASIREPFWNRLQLFAQVFSELSYTNTQYAPIIKHPYHQENVRQLFQQFSSEKGKLLNQWIIEQTFLFEKLERKQANVLASQLTGHNIIGETASQLAKALQMETREFFFYQQDSIEIFIQFVKKYQEKLILTPIILRQVFKEMNLGLSQSTRNTYELIKKGHTIKQIACIRSIKENTVREHILEVAFVFTNFPYAKFIPETIYKQLNQGFSEDENYDYRQAMAENEALEFMHFRLVELERMRMN